MMAGHLNNENIQKELQGMDRKLRDWELADLEFVLRTQQGRRFFYRIVFEVCNVMSPTYDFSIKEGQCANNHSNHREGRRWVGSVLWSEVKENLPDLLELIMHERFARQIDEQAARKRIIDKEVNNGD